MNTKLSNGVHQKGRIFLKIRAAFSRMKEGGQRRVKIRGRQEGGKEEQRLQISVPSLHLFFE